MKLNRYSYIDKYLEKKIWTYRPQVFKWPMCIQPKRSERPYKGTFPFRKPKTQIL